jgi:hypothetical protein
MKKPSIEWVDLLVSKRRARGGYSEEELKVYRAELIENYRLNAPSYPGTCPACRGTGGGEYNDCPVCDGNGVV